MTKPKPTKREADVLAAIKQLMKNGHGLPPTTRELSESLAMKSTNSLRRHIDNLISKGYLARLPNVARGLRVL